MGFFSEIKTECIKCEGEVKYIGMNKGLSILYRSMFIPLCDTCSRAIIEDIIKNKKHKKGLWKLLQNYLTEKKQSD